MRTIRTVVVDDEFLGRSRVKKLLSGFDQIQLVGEGKNGEEAVKLIEDYHPDIVMLDIEMPDKTGIQVMNSFPENERPFFIFITAHDRFALKAFDLKAVDFLHKPYDDERFAKAISHVTEQIELNDHKQLNSQLLKVLDDFKSKKQSNPYIIQIKDRGREISVNLYDVYYIEADGNYLKLQLEKERFLLRSTMQQMTETLDHSCFLRVHRSVIINTNYLKVKSYKGNNEYVFKMRSGEEFISGRSFKEEIDKFFETY
jgi:two-component system LytT family response regulator